MSVFPSPETAILLVEVTFPSTRTMASKERSLNLLKAFVDTALDGGLYRLETNIGSVEFRHPLRVEGLALRIDAVERMLLSAAGDDLDLLNYRQALLILCLPSYSGRDWRRRAALQ